ncbi:MAG: hypothetical protein ACFFBD_11445, partial [Candidatus Hodarchaeota archaeon]
MTNQNRPKIINSNWFTYPFFVTNRRFLPICALMLVITSSLWALYAVEANKVDILISSPIPFALIFFLFAIWAYRYLLKLIERLLGINLNNHIIVDPNPPLRELFNTDTNFKNFQEKFLGKLNTRLFWVAWFALVWFVGGSYLTIIITSTSYVSPPEWHVYTFDYFFGTLWALIIPFFNSLLFGAGFVLLIIIIIVIVSLYKLGLERNLLDIRSIKVKQAIEQSEEVIGQSLKKFKQKALIIPKTALRISGILVICLFFVEVYYLWFIIFILETVGSQGTLGFLFMFVLLNLILLSTILLTFLFPQLGLKRTIANEKEKRMKILEEKYEDKKLQCLQSIIEDINLKEQYSLLNALKIIIDEINALSSWPFDYKQLGALFLSLVSIASLALT